MTEILLSNGITLGLHMMLALSINLMSGYTQQLSLGQAAFAGLGAYTSAWLSLRLGWSFWIACPLSCLATGLCGLLSGLPLLRQPPYYLPAMTFGMNLVIQELLRLGSLGGGYSGLGRIPAPRFLGDPMGTGSYACLVGLALGLCLVIDRWFWRSRFGQTLRQPLLAEPAGPAPAIARATLVAFMISTAMAGGAGSLFAHFEAFISPFDFTLEASLFFLALAAGGGFGSPGGAMLGALLFGGIIENVPGMTQYRLLISGLLLLLVGLWFPRGLYALLTTRRRRA